MADDQKTSGVVIPDDVRAKFGEIVELILGSESMNDEERQYWINILPVMTPEQIQNLRDILENEKKQLKAIDEKYAKELDQAGQSQLVKKMADERMQRKQQREQSESAHAAKEQQEADNLLQQIEGQ